MPTPPANFIDPILLEGEYVPFEEHDAQLLDNIPQVRRMYELDKAKMLYTQQNALSKKKIMPPQEKVSPEKLALLLAEANKTIELFQNQVKQTEKEFHDLYVKHRDLQLKLSSCPDIEETYHAIQVYCKINKIPARIRKGRGMVGEFIGALEHKDVPIGDDELVD